MIFHLFDSSAVVKRYKDEKGSTVVNHTISHPKSRCFIPNVCIPEILTVFAYLFHVGEKQPNGTRVRLSKTNYEKLTATFIKELKERIIYPYELARIHIIRVDPVIDKAFSVKVDFNRYEPVDTVDTLVISMALELHSLFKTNIKLISSDTHQLRTAKALGLKVFDPESPKSVDYLK